MNLDRFQFESMIALVKDAIPDNGDDSGLFVSVDGDVVTFIGGTKNLAKKTTLVIHNDIEGFMKIGKKIPDTFMIPKSSLLGFEKMMKEHKSICKKLGKGEPSYLFIQMSDKGLYSQKESVDFPHPSRKFEDMRALFQKGQAPVIDMIILSGEIDTVLKGFSKSKQIKVTFSGDGETVHFKQKETDHEAFFIPPPEEGDPPMMGDDD